MQDAARVPVRRREVGSLWRASRLRRELPLPDDMTEQQLMDLIYNKNCAVGPTCRSRHAASQQTDSPLPTPIRKRSAATSVVLAVALPALLPLLDLREEDVRDGPQLGTDGRCSPSSRRRLIQGSKIRNGLKGPHPQARQCMRFARKPPAPSGFSVIRELTRWPRSQRTCSRRTTRPSVRHLDDA